jgi:hypothetical protein
VECSCLINQAGMVEGAGERREVKHLGGVGRSGVSVQRPNLEVETELVSKVLNETQGDGAFAPDKSDRNCGGRREEKRPCEREDEDGGVGHLRKAETELESKCGRRGRSWCPVVERVRLRVRAR